MYKIFVPVYFQLCLNSSVINISQVKRKNNSLDVFQVYITAVSNFNSFMAFEVK